MEMGRRWTDGRLSIDIDQSSDDDRIRGVRGAAVGFALLLAAGRGAWRETLADGFAVTRSYRPGFS